MAAEKPKHLPYLNVWLIGVGTVFGTYAVFTAVMLAVALLGVDHTRSFAETIGLVLLSALFGLAIPVMTILALSIPMLLLWSLTYKAMIRVGLNLRHSAMLTAGILSLTDSVTIIVLVGWRDFMRVPSPLWILLVPTPLAVWFARCETMLPDGTNAV